MQILKQYPVAKHTRLSQAFFTTAGEQGASVYLDSFGQPYFFHRSPVELLADSVDHGKERVLMMKLISCDESTAQYLACVTPGVALLHFPQLAQGKPDALFKELRAIAAARNLWARVEPGNRTPFRTEDTRDYYWCNETNDVLVQTTRYPLA